jgi:hypothetical protein
MPARYTRRPLCGQAPVKLFICLYQLGRYVLVRCDGCLDRINRMEDCFPGDIDSLC